MEPIHSTSKTLRMLSLNVEAYGGLAKTDSKDTTLAITFPKDKNLIGFTGNNAVGKTSALRAVLSLLGYEEPDNAINSEVKNKKASLTFQKGENTYTVNMTKSGFSVSMENADGQQSKLATPKESLIKLVGKVSISPMDLKALSGKKQIEWLRQNSNWTKAQSDKENILKEERKRVFDKRTGTNTEAKRIETELLASEYYIKNPADKSIIVSEMFTANAALVAAMPGDTVEVKKEFDDATARKDNFVKATNALDSMKMTAQLQQDEIKRLEQVLAAAKETLKNTESRIIDGEKWIADNSNVLDEYEIAKTKFMEFSNIQSCRREMDQLQFKYEKMEECLQSSITATARIDEIDVELRSLVKDLTAGIEGLEIEIGGLIDNKREEGIYYNNHTMQELSESELWSLYLLLMEKQNTQVVIVENLPSLGTKAIETLNWFANERGGTVFFSAMERKQDTLKVEFYESIS